MVEEARLESSYTSKGYRGFESRPLRKTMNARQLLLPCVHRFLPACPHDGTSHAGTVVRIRIETSRRFPHLPTGLYGLYLIKGTYHPLRPQRNTTSRYRKYSRTSIPISSACRQLGSLRTLKDRKILRPHIFPHSIAPWQAI